ncbi:SCO family protein [Pseudemcibacter aquimaris]|uniref:SCO family protein n=1 Tax=Pseudemcibacter aquimaris TaxID=2857064 RepID=UPI00201250B6|nr:SCO family protein [Pseudemcibacter aquimaris]MCC3861909.1 SCO family protein [Pseudemcibacter aquimaris]WDU58661.1 SCO family protein [Pseudemcibacter aquimaris]
MSKNVQPKKPNVKILLSAVLAIIAAIVWIQALNQDNTPTASENSRALIGGEFALTNHMGEAVTDKDFLGKYMLVYFGYTYCPDVCPMDLQIMADAMNELDPSLVDQINPVFVSVDPERDTVDVMAEYVGFFHKDMIGLTGTVDQVNNIKKAYRVYSAKADDSADYLVDHTSYTYLMDKDGSLLKHFNHGEDPVEMASTITALIN